MKSAAARNYSPFRPASFGRFRVLDYFVFFFASAAFCVSAFFVYGGPAQAAQVSVNGRAGAWLYPFDVSETISVSGPLGDTIVAIDDGKAWIVSSPCRNQTCVAAPPLRRRGQWTACLPNQVLVNIDGSGGGAGADAFSAGTENLVDGISW
jgi:hypothetical protein